MYVGYKSITLPRIRGTPIYDDPIDALMAHERYEVKPSRYELPYDQSITGIVSVQPMTAPTESSLFQIEFVDQKVNHTLPVV